MNSSLNSIRCQLRLFAALALIFPLVAPAQIVSQVNPSNAIVAVGGSDSYTPITSPDGRFLVFASTANNLAVGSGAQAYLAHVPAQMNVFLRDRQLGVTTLVSVNAAGTAGGNGPSYPSAISSDGRYVAFESLASDLVPGDTNGVKDIFVRDLTLGLTTLVSASTNGSFGNGESREAAMTPNGRYVAFVSAASNLSSNDTNGIADVFVRDLQAGVTTLASVGATQVTNANLIATPYTAGSSSEWPVLSADGRYVAFYSTAVFLLPNLTNTGEIFIRDLVNGVTLWASANAHAIFAAPISTSYAMTPDGQYLAYYASQNGTPGSGGVFRYHLASGATDLAATNGYVGLSLDTGERALDISTNGQFITFMETNLGANASIQIWNAQTGSASLVSGGVTNADCAFPRLDATGRYVAFISDEPSLATNSDSSAHVYVRDTVTGNVQLADLIPSGSTPFTTVTEPPFVSANGNLVAFMAPDGSFAVSRYKYDAFARDLVNNVTQVISPAFPSLGSLTGPGSSSITTGCVSSNGQFVAFASDADGLASIDTNGCRDIYTHNLLTGSNTLVSVTADGTASGNLPSFGPAINASGRYVFFTSAATNLIPTDTNGMLDVFVRDLQSNTTSLVSVDASGQGEGNANSSLISVSADGRYALFLSGADNLVTNAVNTRSNVFYRRDLQLGVTTAISPAGGIPTAAMTPDGSNVIWANFYTGYLWQAATQTSTAVVNAMTPPPVGILDMAISANGQKAVFASSAEVFIVDLIARTNSVLTSIAATSRPRFQFSADGHLLACLTAVSKTNQLYLYDLVAQTNVLISRAFDGAGPGDGACDSPTISPDGRFIAYRSFADNLVPGDTNAQPDIFLYDRLSGGTTLVSVSQSGNRPGNGFSLSPVFSSDGHTLFFDSWATDLAPGDFNEWADVFALPLSPASPVASTNAAAPLDFRAISFENFAGTGSVGGLPTLTWPTSFGAAYQVQFKNSLSDPAWQNLSSPVTIVGSQGNVTDPAPNAPQRFYRIVSF